MVWYFVIGLNIIAVALAIFFIFKFKKKWKGIKHYEKIRDELTTREEEEEPEEEEEEEDEIVIIQPEEEEEGSGGMLGNILGGFITILIGINVLPTVADMVDEVSNTTTFGGASSTIIGIVPFLFCLLIFSAGLAFVVSGLRNAGLL